MPKSRPESVRREHLHLHEERLVLTNYIKVRLRREDWHGVRDACSDLEAIDARLNQIARMELLYVEDAGHEVPGVRKDTRAAGEPVFAGYEGQPY